jgi:hypothetical protein
MKIEPNPLVRIKKNIERAIIYVRQFVKQHKTQLRKDYGKEILVLRDGMRIVGSGTTSGIKNQECAIVYGSIDHFLNPATHQKYQGEY